MKITVKKLRELIVEAIQPYPKFNRINDAVYYLDKNWKKISGMPSRMKHEEGYWSEGVEEFIAATGFDELEFQDAWTEYWG